MNSWKDLVRSIDSRRDWIVPGNQSETIHYCVQQFVSIAQESIQRHGKFFVALSGGSTPKALFEKLAQAPYRDEIPWESVRVFWSDERCVPPESEESNYRMAQEALLKHVPLDPHHIFRMAGEKDPEDAGHQYDEWIRQLVPGHVFDLIMLGVGEDGHTASLFPKTHGLHTLNRFAIANFIPQKEIWRLTLTFECLNQSRHTQLYVLGKSKAAIVKKVLTSPYNPDELPVQRVGIEDHKALWILDRDAAGDTFTTIGI